MRYLLSLILFFSFVVLAENYSHTMQRVIFNANIVASACHVRVDADGVGNNLLTFGTYNKSIGDLVPPKVFIVRLFESGSTIQGCSAFLAGQVATLKFGNPGQLDATGVITRGAGDRVRIDVRASDGQADWRERIVTGHETVNYPVDFAALGQFRFMAQPVFPADVSAGSYDGALSFVVSYQ